MSDLRRPRLFVLGIVICALVLAVSAPAEAQRSYEPLFDKFNFKAELSWIGPKKGLQQHQLASKLLGIIRKVVILGQLHRFGMALMTVVGIAGSFSRILSLAGRLRRDMDRHVVSLMGRGKS